MPTGIPITVAATCGIETSAAAVASVMPRSVIISGRILAGEIR
jgi:hypothetical protein